MNDDSGSKSLPHSRSTSIAPISFLPLGDRALLACFDNEREAKAWRNAVEQERWEWVRDLVLAYQTVGIYWDPDRIDPQLATALISTIQPQYSDSSGKLWTIPVLYDGADLVLVAKTANLTIEQVIEAHSSQRYEVYAIGFQPGFPYAGNLPKSLEGQPRHDSPRPEVPAGSVAIAGRQTAIYPRKSPGGWRLLGRTPLVICDPQIGHFPIQAGDRLQFQPVSQDEFSRYARKLLSRDPVQFGEQQG